MPETYEYKNPHELELFYDRSVYISTGKETEKRAFHLGEYDMIVTFVPKPEKPKPIEPGTTFIIEGFDGNFGKITVIASYGDEVWVYDEDGDTEIYGAAYIRTLSKV